jgi:copper(I)-binding protein
MKAIRIVLLVAGLVLGTGTASAQTGQLEVSNAWARATPGRSEVSAAYVTIRSPTADRLVAASSPIAKKVGIHTMTMSGMVMQMRPVAAIDIPARQPVTLAPDGLHIMLEGLKKPLRAGQSFPLTLTFEKAASERSRSRCNRWAQWRRCPGYSTSAHAHDRTTTVTMAERRSAPA